MRIAIEAQRIFRPNKHGMDFVALETIRVLQQIDKENEYFIFVSPGEDRCLTESANVHIIELKCPTYVLWEQVALPRAVAKVKADLLHCTSNTAPIWCKVPLVLTLHDIIFLQPREGKSASLYQNLGWYYRRLVVPRILAKCRKIITVSNYERNNIINILGLPAEQLVAVYNGFGSHFKPLEDASVVTGKYLPEADYMFFLGNTDPKKNTLRILKAYALYADSCTNPLPLLIADLKEEVIDEALDRQGISHIKPLLRYPGYIPNKDLPYIYSGASIFLYASLRESFGIPLLESMACGTPVITSNITAMPEIAGEGSILIDPYNEQAIADALIKLVSDPVFYQGQVAYGLERVKQFSWESTARATLQLYKSVLNKQ